MSERIWQSIPNISFYDCSDNEIIIYNPLSGETHQLNLLALDVLTFLNQPATVDALNHYISSLYESWQDMDVELQLLVEQFDEIGLIS